MTFGSLKSQYEEISSWKAQDDIWPIIWGKFSL